ncbi:hypothetical protein BLA29_006539, partial [Euroglyphus maynei]
AYAIGPGSNLLRGSQEQTYIAHLIEFTSCIGDYVHEPHCSGCRTMITCSTLLIVIVSLSHLIRFSL